MLITSSFLFSYVFAATDVEREVDSILENKPLSTNAQYLPQYLQSAEKIRQLYDTNFIRLSSGARNHYAPRMYRLTGDEYYAKLLGNQIYQITDRLNLYLANLDDKQWRITKSNEMIANLPKTRRGKARKKVLSGTSDKRFALYVVYQLAKLQEYGLEHPGHRKFVSYLKGIELKALLLSKDFIKAYAAQVANYVYWLRTLGIEDWTADLQQAFANAYPDNKDSKLKKRAFSNKLYGLTHIVLADSDYYQHNVSATEHKWILDYFRANKDRITKDAKADILAEIGLCFLLTEQYQDPLLAEMKKLINQAIDPDKNMILSVKGNDNLSSGEHRNILAYALLNWPNTLYKGPILLNDEKLRRTLPLMYQKREQNEP